MQLLAIPKSYYNLQLYSATKLGFQYDWMTVNKLLHKFRHHLFSGYLRLTALGDWSHQDLS